MEKIPFTQSFVGAVLVAVVGGLIVHTATTDKQHPTLPHGLLDSKQGPEAPVATAPPTRLTGNPADREGGDESENAGSSEPSGPAGYKKSPLIISDPRPSSEDYAAEDWRRTVVFIFGETVPGQALFIRGGAGPSSSRTCRDGGYDCALPIRHRNLQNDTKPWKVGEKYLDRMGPEPEQTEITFGIRAYGTPLDWTTDRWPSEWGTAKTVEWDGHGVEKLNRWGLHYWMLDVDMDCSRTTNGWFDFTSYITNGPGGEREISQPGAPYSGANHFAKCGGLSAFRRGQDIPLFIGEIPSK